MAVFMFYAIVRLSASSQSRLGSDATVVLEQRLQVGDVTARQGWREDTGSM